MYTFLNQKEAETCHLKSAEQFTKMWLGRLSKSLKDPDIQKPVLENFLKDIQSADAHTLMKSDVIMQIAEQLSESEAIEFFKGGHFMINDNGQFFDTLKWMGYERISSHHNHKKLEGVSDVGIKAGETFAQLLIGKTTEGYSWFQLENSPMPTVSEVLSSTDAFTDFINHSVDTINYMAHKIGHHAGITTAINIGPYGQSLY